MTFKDYLYHLKPDEERLGLLNGNIGYAIVFFSLGKSLQDTSWEEKAIHFIDTSFQILDFSCDRSYRCGLSGIGVGIEYLIREGYIKESGNDILEELDDLIFRTIAFKQMPDLSLQNGYIGSGRYLARRIQGQPSTNKDIITIRNREAMIHMMDLLDYGRDHIEIGSEDIIIFLEEAYSLDVINYKVEKLLRFYLNQPNATKEALLQKAAQLKVRYVNRRLQQLEEDVYRISQNKDIPSPLVCLLELYRNQLISDKWFTLL